RVGIYILQHGRKSVGINGNVEASKIGEAAVCKILIRHSNRVVKDVVEVCAERSGQPLAYLEVFVQTKIYAPSYRSPQKVLSGDAGIGEDVGAHRRRGERIRIKKLIRYMLLVVADDHRSVADEVCEISQRVHRFRRNVPWPHHTDTISAVITRPIWCECGAAFREHLKRRLPAANNSIGPPRKSGSKPLILADRQVVYAIKNKSMTRDPGILRVIALRIKWVVRHSTQAGIAAIDPRGFLVRISVRGVQH